MTKTTEQYINFARKYRPSNFLEVHGQEVLTKILSYAILKERIAQGYLLTGIRGVGKTTSARIIAKTINCTDPVITQQNIKPCEQCQNCLSFNKNNHPDIVEIDAASKTSIDDIRKIIESSEYKPLIGRYSIFIIDEVHMLSKGAFNALLKILEEPPAHIIFIFATTEPQKIPLTVISRCQRYDLKRLTFNEILHLLKGIAEKERLKIEEEALRVIASRSDGSARDAISVLDQVVGLGEGESITSADVCRILGLVDTSSVIKFFEAVIKKDVGKSLDLLNGLYVSSANLEIFITLVADFVAYLSKVKLLPSYQNPIYQSFSKEIEEILGRATTSRLSVIWQIYSKGIMDMKVSHNQMIEAEMLAIKSIYSQMLPSIEELSSESIQERQPAANYPITDFLNYLHSNNEMEIYYQLMHNLEVKSFSNDTIEIAGKDLNKKMQEQLSSLLSRWSGRAYKVIVSTQEQILTIKEQFIDKVRSSKDWEILIKHFPEITISDILLAPNKN